MLLKFDAAATVSHFALDPQEEISFGLKDLAAVHAICDTGDSTTLTIIESAGYFG